MLTVARQKNIRITAQKLRLIADQIRMKPADKALDILRFSPKRGALIVRKVLESAIANAENNDGMDADDLHVAEIHVDEGPSMKRMRARARGRANRITKRMSHLTVYVAELAK